MGSLSLQKLLSPKGLKKPPISQGIIRQLVFFQGDDCVTGAHLLREENEALRDNALERSIPLVEDGANVSVFPKVPYLHVYLHRTNLAEEQTSIF